MKNEPFDDAVQNLIAVKESRRGFPISAKEALDLATAQALLAIAKELRYSNELLESFREFKERKVI